MIIPFSCPSCSNEIEAEVKGMKRRVVTCTSCNNEVQIPDDLPIGPGVVIGNGYKLYSKIGDTSLGDLYLADRNGSKFTVEVLSGETSKDQEKVTRLMQETDLIASMEHPHIVKAIEAGQDNETYFLVTAFEPGMPLSDYLKQNGPLTCGEALTIATHIAEALKYAWEEKRLLHRDIKPHNIFVTESGEARLTGFGIAKASGGPSLGLTGIGFTIGTPEYMSPEQIRAADDLDFRSDLYALGCVLYESVCGGMPFQETAPMLLVQKHMDEVPEPAIDRNPDVTPACSDLIDKMLLKDRSERQGSWQELIDEMADAIANPGEPKAQKSAAAADPAPAPSSGHVGVAGSDIQKEATSSSKTMLVAGVAIGLVIVVLLIMLVVLLTNK